MNLNKLFWAGFLTRDPELRYTPSGKAVANFCVASNHTWTDESGNKQSEPTFLDFTAWGKTAEIISQYFKKDRGIILVGRLKLESWEDKQTREKRSKHIAIVESFSFPNEGSDDQGQDQRPAATGAQPPPKSQPPRTMAERNRASRTPDPNDMPPEDDDVPFNSMPKSMELRMLGIPTINKLA